MRMGNWVLLAATAALGLGAQSPRIFFADLESGPNSGGEGNGGAFVTIWGRNFGSDRGAATVTAGGGPVTGYPVRTVARITFQLGPQARTGQIIVTTAAGASNGVPFAVRPGNLYFYFASTSGNDSSPGTVERPWRTVTRAVEAMRAGDITYIRDGAVQAAGDVYGAALSIQTGGTEGLPVALAAYPGEKAAIGSPELEFGLRIPNIDEAAAADHWVISQLTLRGGVQAASIEGPSPAGWRVVGNGISCPNGDGQTGCVSVSLGRNIKFFGNEVHHTGRRGASKQYHAVYFTTGTNGVDAGWNYIHDNSTCRAIQFHSSPLCHPDCGARDTTGRTQYDLTVHDNLIRGDACDGINFATVHPSKGKVEAYNNVIIRAGAGPHPPDGSANYACIYVPGGTNTGTDGAGSVEVYNNTCYDFGAVDPGFPDAGAFVRGDGSPRLFLNLRNNIAYAVGRQNYLSGTVSLITGSNNLWFGNGPGPASLERKINADPQFVSLAENDLRLQSGSPAIDAGVSTGPATDFDGAPRPQGQAFDAGAFEFVQGTAAPPSAPGITPGGVVNAFSGVGGAVSPGEIVSIFGRAIGSSVGMTASLDPASGRLPLSAGGYSVTFNGIPAPIYFARSDQVKVQVPYELAGVSEAVVAVAAPSGSSAPERVRVAATHPGLHPIVFNQDFSVHGPENAAAGSVVVLFAIGQGAASPPGVTRAPPAGGVLLRGWLPCAGWPPANRRRCCSTG